MNSSTLNSWRSRSHWNELRPALWLPGAGLGALQCPLWALYSEYIKGQETGQKEKDKKRKLHFFEGYLNYKSSPWYTSGFFPYLFWQKLSSQRHTSTRTFLQSLSKVRVARILEWSAISYSRRSSQPRDRTHVSCIADGFFTTEPPGKPISLLVRTLIPLWELHLSNFI